MLVAGLFAGYATAVIMLLFAGMFSSVANAASGRAVMSWFGANERGFALGLRQMSIPLAAAAAAILLPLIALRFGVPIVFEVLGLLMAAAAVASAVWLRRVAAHTGSKTGPTLNPIRDPRLWRLALGCGMLAFGQVCISTYLPLYLAGQQQWSLAAVGALLMFCQLGAAGMRVGSGILSDRLRLRVQPMRWLALAGAMLLAATAVAIGTPLAGAALAVTMVVTMSSNGLAFAAAGEMAGPGRAGAAMGFQNTAVFAAAAVAPVAFALLIGAVGWRWAVALLVLTAVTGWLVLGPLEGEETRGWHRLAADA
jgi:sugar phosphate permease